MTDPQIKTTAPVKADAYVKLQAGVYEARKDTVRPDIGVVLGGEISKGGTYAKAEAGYGTALKAGIEAGHEFNIGKNMGLELSANAKYLRANTEGSFSSTIVHDFNVDSEHVHNEDTFKKDWHDGYKKFGASAMLNFKGKAGNVKVGLESGYRTNNAPDISHTMYTTAENNGATEIRETSVMFKGRESGAYVTPKISAELNLGKKGHWSLTANADRFEGSAGVKYTF